MIPRSFLNPSTSVLPFNMFRSFGPVLDKEWQSAAWTPPCDIYETDKEIVLKMELPEMEKEDVHVTLENNVLTVRGERKFEETVKHENYFLVERKRGEFSRSFGLPSLVDGSKLLAEFKQGTLTVTLPKNA